MVGDRDERVRQRAYEIWESEDRPSGRHDEHWSRAEQELETGESGEGESVAVAARPKRSGTRRAPGSTEGATAAGRSRRAAKPTP